MACGPIAISPAQLNSTSSLGGIARMLNTSERTLKRRLQQEGTSFRAQVAAAQASAAAELIRLPALSATAIAERLGHADLSTFSQAFKRWHGVSPDAFRRGGSRSGSRR